MARKKSYNDITKQRNRLLSRISSDIGMGATRTNNVARYRRVEEIYDRYVRNIANSKSAKRLQANANKKLAISREEFNAYRDKARNRKYSQSTYMGLTNG